MHQAQSQLSSVHRKAVVAVWWQWHAGCRGKDWTCCFHSVCSVHFALHILEPWQALGNRALSQRLTCKNGRAIYVPMEGKDRPGGFWLWAAAPVSGETSVMTDLEQCDTEQEHGQDTKMCLGLGQGRHWAEFLGTSWGEEHVEPDSLSQTSFCDTSSNECKQPIGYVIHGLKTGSPFEIQEQLPTVGWHYTQTRAEVCTDPLCSSSSLELSNSSSLLVLVLPTDRWGGLKHGKEDALND